MNHEMNSQISVQSTPDFSSVDPVIEIRTLTRFIVWDEEAALAQQTVEYDINANIPCTTICRMRRKLRLSRIEEECARVRRPVKSRSSLRPVLRLINSCPPTTTAIPAKEPDALHERFRWLKTDRDTNEVFCSLCIERTEAAPKNLKTRGTEVRWELTSPKGQTLAPKIELHACSSFHAWSSAVHSGQTRTIPSL